MFRFCHCLGANCMSGFHKYLKTLIIVTIVVMIHPTHTPLHDYCCTPILFCSNWSVASPSLKGRTTLLMSLKCVIVQSGIVTILCTCTFLFKKHPHTWHKYIWTLQGKKYFRSYFHYGIQFFVIYEFIPSRFCSSDWNQILIFFSASVKT